MGLVWGSARLELKVWPASWGLCKCVQVTPLCQPLFSACTKAAGVSKRKKWHDPCKGPGTQRVSSTYFLSDSPVRMPLFVSSLHGSLGVVLTSFLPHSITSSLSASSWPRSSLCFSPQRGAECVSWRYGLGEMSKPSQPISWLPGRIQDSGP